MQKCIVVRLNEILKVIILICIARWGPNKKCTIFQITFSRSNLNAPSINKNGKPSTLNPCREIQGLIIVYKTLLHIVKHEPWDKSFF